MVSSDTGIGYIVRSHTNSAKNILTRPFIAMESINNLLLCTSTRDDLGQQTWEACLSVIMETSRWTLISALISNHNGYIGNTPGLAGRTRETGIQVAVPFSLCGHTQQT